MRGKYSYKFSLSIGYPAAVRSETTTVGDMGYDEDEWDELSAQDMENALEEALEDWAGQFIQQYWE